MVFRRINNFFEGYFSSFWGDKSQSDQIPTQLETGTVQTRIIVLLFLSWIVTMLGLGTLSNYNLMIPGGKFLLHLSTGWILAIGFVAMVWMWRRIPQTQESRWDISPWTARAWFWFFMALAVYLRVFDIEIPTGDWWDDHFIHTSDIRAIIDYRWHPIFFPSGARESFFPYLTAFLWSFSPQTTGLEIMQYSNTAIDLLSIWVFYLLGKEIAGRRMGVIFLGMGAICKLMVQVTKNQMGCDSCVLGGAIAILFLIRLVKKQDLLHFVEWGLAIGFGGYTYVPLRPWLPVMLGGVFLWVWSKPLERRFNVSRWILGPGLLIAWAFLFVYKNGFLHVPFLVDFLTNKATLILTASLFMVCYLNIFLREKKEGFSKLFMWATGSFVVALVMTPAYLYPFYGSHVSSIAVFSKDMVSSMSVAWSQFLGNVRWVIPMFFGPVGAPVSLPWLGDSMYDFFVAACGLLGLAYFFARPKWIPAMTIVFLFVSFIPGIMSNGPHTQRYVASNTPLLLMAALGVNRLWLGVLQVKYTRSINLFCAIAVIVFTSWQLYQNMNIYKVWMSHRCQDALLYDQVMKEYPSHRVYLKFLENDHFYNTGMDILGDGKTVYTMQDSNPIDLKPGEAEKDLTIMVSGEDVTAQEKIEKEFPNIPWNKQFMFLQEPNSVPFVWWVEVPFDRLKKSKKGLFHVRHASSSDWTRRYYGRYGMGRGLIRYEDRARHWNDPLEAPKVIELNSSMRIAGPLNIKTAGDYVFSFQTGNVFWVYLDGKKVLAQEHGESGGKKTYKTFLTLGVHQVEVANDVINEYNVPTVMILAPGESKEVPLDDFALSTQPFDDAGQDPNKGTNKKKK
jgi:hypothetical protein